MKFIISREVLFHPLQQIANVIEKKQTMAILSNILLFVESNQLTMTGTDLEIQLVAKVEVEEQEAGRITVPSRKLLDICRLLPNEAQITFELVENKIKITSGRSRFLLSTLVADNYPKFSESESSQVFEIKSNEIKLALDKTTFCMANQDIRYYLNGVLLIVENNKLKVVASDGHRLSVYENDLDIDTECEIRIILPRKGVLELARLLLDDDSLIQFEISSNNIRIVIDNYTFYAKLVDAKYPDFSQPFNQPFNEVIQVESNALKEVVSRVSILANERFKGIKMDIGQDLVKLSAHNPDQDEAEEELNIQYKGQPFSVTFNYQYLLDAVNKIDSEHALFTISEDISCCIISVPDQNLYQFIVMPMKL